MYTITIYSRQGSSSSICREEDAVLAGALAVRQAQTFFTAEEKHLGMFDATLSMAFSLVPQADDYLIVRASKAWADGATKAELLQKAVGLVEYVRE